MKHRYVLYHSPCFDGTAAAYAAWLKFKSTAIYLPVTYHKPVPDMVLGPDTEIYLVDFSYPRTILEELHRQVGTLVVLDHHESAADQLDGLDYCTFDMTRAGCEIAWEYFQRDTPWSNAMPALLRHVADRDLWAFQLPDTKAVMAGLRQEIQYDRFEHFHQLTKAPAMQRLLENGKLIVDYNDEFMKKFIQSDRNFKILHWNGHRVALFNNTFIISELSDAFQMNRFRELAIDITCNYHFDSEGQLKLSFRSKNGSNISTLDLSGKLGGGGHKHSSGTELSMEQGLQLMQWLYSKDHLNTRLDEQRNLIEF